MCPISKTDGHDGPRLIDEFVPSIATVVEYIVVGEEHAVGEPVVADELPDVLDRVEFWALRRQWHERDVGRYGELVRQVPSRLVDEECGVTARRDGCGDLGQMQVHRLGIASRQDERCTLAKRGADGSEDVGGSGALIGGRGWPRSAFGPATGDLVLLSDPGFVGEPDLYRDRLDTLVLRDLAQDGGETFLKCSIAPAAWAWWRGRAVSLR